MRRILTCTELPSSSSFGGGANISTTISLSNVLGRFTISHLHTAPVEVHMFRSYLNTQPAFGTMHNLIEMPIPGVSRAPHDDSL